MFPMKFLIKIMKSYTNLEQSKKLAEILPPESADMFLVLNGTQPVMSKYIDDGFVTADNTAIPCWSLAALIELMGECRMERTPLDQSGAFTHSFVDDYYNIRTFEEDNAVDAAVEMIYKLKEKDLL